SSSKSLHTRLKSLLTERRQQIEEKQEQARMVSTYTRFILASNERRPIRFSPNERERRWFVVRFMEHRHNPVETGEFIGRLAQWLTQDGSLDAIY
ncbi:primase-helicase family protein, partial [Klebsiella pneumoniae]